ncbi:MAG: ABC transporter permease [Verrucomicrobiota bacterium]
MKEPSTIVSETEIVIEPSRGFHLFSWRDLYAYRDLLWLLVWRDFAARYKQTILGPLWFIIQPLLMTLVFTVVFGKFAGIKTPGTPPILFYLCGLLAWNYFAQTFQSTSSTLVTNAGIFSKVYFPRLIVPLSSVISNLAALAIQLVTFGAVYGAYAAIGMPDDDTGLRWQVIFLPLVVLQVAALGLGIGLWLAALTTRYRDFTVLAGFLLQLWLYGTPIIYPLQNVPLAWKFAVELNPMTMPVETFRFALLGAGSPEPRLIILSAVVTIACLITGLVAFKRVERTFVDIA